MQPSNEELKNAVTVNTVQIVQMPKSLPFDISNGLNQFQQVFITKNTNKFRIFHCCESFMSPIMKEYIVYGELPDGDKKILFTVRPHFQCCNCCNSCSITFCCCGDYVLCNKILIQFDYKRNDTNFYTHGQYIVKGCYICKDHCCHCCNEPWYLRYNTEPDNPDFTLGIHQGNTVSNKSCFSCQDKTVIYYSEEGEKGHTLRLSCCDVLKLSIPCFFARCQDIDIAIEDKNGLKTGNIIVPNGCCSSKVDSICYTPGDYFQVNYPENISSLEKFQIIAEAIHFDREYMILV